MSARNRPERGMVTAETAVLAPLVVLCLAVGVWVVSLAHTQTRLVDASRDVARLVARGESPGSAITETRAEVSDDARFVVERRDGFVTVRVSVRSRSPLPGLSWPLSARSIAVDET